MSETELFEVVHDLAGHVQPPQGRTLRLANGDEYNIVVSEVAQRSEFFGAMFREDGFAESSEEEKVITLDLPHNDSFEDIYVYLMTGTITDDLTMPQMFVQHVMNAEYLGVGKLMELLLENFKERSEYIATEAETKLVAKLPQPFLLEMTEKFKKLSNASLKLEQQTGLLPPGTPVRSLYQGRKWYDGVVIKFDRKSGKYRVYVEDDRSMCEYSAINVKRRT